MSTRKTIMIYEFSELGDAAKETARNWLRECKASDEWWDSTYEDAEQVHLKIDSFDLDRAQIDGHFLEDALATAHAVTDEHGDACETYKTAAAFLAARDKLVDEWPRDEDGEIDDERAMDDALDEMEAEFLHDILEDYRIMLRDELEYQMSDACIDGDIEANEYTFNERGEREDV